MISEPYKTANDLRWEIKALCDQSTQKEVAADLGISEQYLSDLVTGRRNISLRIATLLGYDMYVFYTPTNPETNP